MYGGVFLHIKLNQHATTFYFVDMHNTCNCVGLEFIYVNMLLIFVNNKVSYVKKKNVACWHDYIYMFISQLLTIFCLEWDLLTSFNQTWHNLSLSRDVSGLHYTKCQIVSNGEIILEKMKISLCINHKCSKLSLQ